MRFMFLGEKVRTFTVSGTKVELHPRCVVGGELGETLAREYPILFRPVADKARPMLVKS